MERHVDLKEISDGKRYTLEDMVRADCGGCEGCSACCRGMGTSVVLDPLDVHRLVTGTGYSFEYLLQNFLELNVVDGLILPNLKMAGEQEACGFLGKDGRCTIHSHRPGICRLFPLGRLYEDGQFSYFLQVHECKKGNRTKVKVKKWIDTPQVKHYDAYITRWHFFLKALSKAVLETGEDNAAKTISMYVLKQFYLTPFVGQESEFYDEFEVRIQAACDLFGIKVLYS